jgi:hypothetical protein
MVNRRLVISTSPVDLSLEEKAEQLMGPSEFTVTQRICIIPK